MNKETHFYSSDKKTLSEEVEKLLSKKGEAMFFVKRRVSSEGHFGKYGTLREAMKRARELRVIYDEHFVVCDTSGYIHGHTGNKLRAGASWER
jgi:hypothetical protein